MEMKVEIPFKQFLTAVKTLTYAEKAMLRQELSEEKAVDDDKVAFIEMLLNRPVYTEKEIETIDENRKSIIKWRTKS